MRLLERSLKLADVALAPVEKLLVRRFAHQRLGFPPVFIIGSPRSGSTLLYQLLCQRYHFVYFTNFTAQLYRAPVIATWVSNLLFRKRGSQTDYQSVYGKTERCWGPHEGGQFWYRWFPKGEHVYVAAGETNPASLEWIRGEILGMMRVQRAPALLKNTYNSMRVAPLLEAFPDACFLTVKRDPVNIAQSILHARIKLQGDKQRWWALPPKDVDWIKELPYWEQVVEQVYSIYRQIETDRAQFGESHFFDVCYESLCDDVHGSLVSIQTFLEDRGLQLSVRSEVPAQFQRSVNSKVSADDLKLIQKSAEAKWK
jgi:hypothetical protein